jgi:hypothetical protein
MVLLLLCNCIHLPACHSSHLLNNQTLRMRVSFLLPQPGD